MSSDRVRRLSSAGVSYEDRGDGPPVILVHGWCLSAKIWMYLAERLAVRHRVLVPDLPGFGRSDGLAGPFTLERHADALSDLIEELGLRRPILVGFAYGAAAVMILAGRGGGPDLGGIVAIGTPSAAEAPYDRMPRAMRRDWPDFAERSAHAICKQPQSAATLRWLAEIFGSTPLPTALATVAELGAFEPVAVAPAIRVPALFLHGAEDDIVPVAVSKRCAELVPGAQLHVLEESGHFPVLDQPARLAEAVEGFVMTIATAGAA